MRRALPFVIVILGLLAIIVNFFPAPIQTLINGVSPADEPRTIETKLGLDLVGGLQVEYRLVPVGDRQPDAGALATTKTIVENRVNSQGVTEPVVQTQGSDRVVVELPGVTDPGEIRKLLGRTGALEFVPLPADTYGTSTSPGPQFATEGQPLPTVEEALFTGAEIADAFPSTDDTGGRAVGFKLKDTGAKLFGDYTSAHIGEYFAIVLDGNVVSAPYIQSAITGGSGIITGGGSGGFSAKEMNQLVTILDYGSLPFPLEEMSFQEIGATLAGFSFDAMLFAGLVAIILVLAFMIIYYRLPGIVACFALIFYALIVFAIFRLIPVTLTLAGIAGFVLSVGMAVDANILIFERMREELRVGKTLPAAIEAGFNRAWNSILDSNVSSLITATVLYVFGTSVIRGFALVLIIGVLVSMFTAITVTRTILRLVVDVEAVRRPSLWGVSEEEWMARAVRPSTRREARTRV
ncbi:MAG: protein translocase subunit SecD [Chloroflexi bacterium]|jgi:preprotein translocase subunit SecD|nr:protein translocase subunit SecD [Chloroflexota bacterium]